METAAAAAAELILPAATDQFQRVCKVWLLLQANLHNICSRSH